MVITSGNNIKSAYVRGQKVSAIYTYGEQVWPSNIKSYYVRWSPSHISSGTFMNRGRTYQFSHYGSEFWMSESHIGIGAFESSPITTLETNTLDIRSDAFKYCESLSIISLPNCEIIGSSAFGRKTTVITQLRTSLYAPVCSYIGNAAFYERDFSSYSLPNCEYIGDYAFANTGWASSLDLPKCSYIGEYAFDGADLLIEVHLSVCEYIGDMAFVNGNKYEYNSHFLSVYIYTSTVCSLGGSYAFRSLMGNTPNQSFYDVATIYVPASLLSDYKSAQYWSDFSSRLRSM